MVRGFRGMIMRDILKRGSAEIVKKLRMFIMHKILICFIIKNVKKSLFIGPYLRLCTVTYIHEYCILIKNDSPCKFLRKILR